MTSLIGRRMGPPLNPAAPFLKPSSSLLPLECRLSLRERACFRGAKDDTPAPAEESPFAPRKGVLSRSERRHSGGSGPLRDRASRVGAPSPADGPATAPPAPANPARRWKPHPA